MGRKVHPVGFRLKIVKDWQGRWCAKGRRYANQLHEDLKIREKIQTEYAHGAIALVDIQRFPNLVHVTVHTAKPGVLIGGKGATIKKVREELTVTCGMPVKVDIAEITAPDLNAALIAQNVASQLERRISHQRALKRAVAQAMRVGAQGIKVMVSGRLNGSDMTRREWVREGRVPLQTLRANLDYARATAPTTYGGIGVKVWVYTGTVSADGSAEKAETPATKQGD